MTWESGRKQHYDLNQSDHSISMISTNETREEKKGWINPLKFSPVPVPADWEAGRHGDGVLRLAENSLHQPAQAVAVERPDDVQPPTE